MKHSQFTDISLDALRRPYDRDRLAMLLARLLAHEALVRALLDDSTPASSPLQRTEEP